MVTRHRIGRLLSIQEIKAYTHNVRTHSKAQICQLRSASTPWFRRDETLTLIGRYVELGRHGHSRSNVWNYRGVNTFGARLWKS
jgi:hypothetical protein